MIGMMDLFFPFIEYPHEEIREKARNIRKKHFGDLSVINQTFLENVDICRHMSACVSRMSAKVYNTIHKKVFKRF